MSPSFPTRRALATLLLLAGFAMALPRFLTHGPYPRLGARVAADGVVEEILGPPASGLLRPGDRLLSVGGIEVGDPAALERLAQDGGPRGPLEVVYEHDGVVLAETLPPTQLSPWQRFRLAAAPIGLAVAAPVVAFLLAWRRPDLVTARVFLVYALLFALGVLRAVLPYAQAELSPWLRSHLLVYETLVMFYPAAFVHFMMLFPHPRRFGRDAVRRAWNVGIVANYLVAAVLIVVVHLPWGVPIEVLTRDWPAVATLLGTGVLLQRYLTRGPEWAPDVPQRALAIVVAIAMLASNLVFGGETTDAWLVRLSETAPAHVVFTLLFALWLVTPFLLSYLIADDPMFDPRRIIVGGLPYALLSALLAAVHLAIVLGGQRLFADVTGEQAPGFNLLAALVLAFAFAPLRDQVQRLLARLFGRDLEALRRALDQTDDRLLSALDADEVRVAVERGLEQGLGRAVALRWEGADGPALTAPERLPRRARGPVVALLRHAAVRVENLRLSAERVAATRAELRALQAQVQPHFLFNALNALAYLIETDPRAAQRFTGRLADMLRYTVEAGQRVAVPLADEVAFVEDYLGVARERYENAIEFTTAIEPGLGTASVPPLLLQPLVENSLKHGLPNGDRTLHLELVARRERDRFVLRFRDDGVPRGSAAPGTGVGLENLEQRVRHFGGPEARMTAARDPEGGFVVDMTWPVSEGERE
ncbi:MAG: histidine kinase [bacterium]